jgi:hypothetical protein
MNLPAMSKGGALEEGKKKRLQQKWLVRYIRKVIFGITLMLLDISGRIIETKALL